MDQACFDAWLEGIRSLTVEQRGLGFRELALAEAEESGPAVWGSPDASARPVAKGPAGKVPDEAVAEPVSLAHRGRTQGQPDRLPSLRQPEVAALGLRQWAAALSLHNVPTQFQCSNGHAIGTSAQKGAVVGSGGGIGHRGEPGEGGRAMRCCSHYGISLAASLSHGGGARQAVPTGSEAAAEARSLPFASETPLRLGLTAGHRALVQTAGSGIAQVAWWL